MALIQSDFAKGLLRTPTPLNAGESAPVRFYFTLTAAQNVLNNILELGILPAGCSVDRMILDSDDLDTNGSPAITLDVGLMTGQVGALLNDDGSARTIGAEFFAASTVAQAGGVAGPTLKTAYRIAPSSVDRSIGVKIAAASATAAQGEIGLNVGFRS